MSLLAWYPFNGDYTNNGCGDSDLTVTITPTYTTSGKIGKALATGGFSWTASQTNSILNNNELTIAFWVYPINTPTTDTKYNNIIFGTSGMTAPNNRRFSVFLYPSCNDLHLSWQNSDSNSTFLGSIDYGVFPTGKWTHCCITYKNPTATVYINGVLLNTKTGTSASADFNVATQVITSDANRYINDFRVYDNALSAKEVKELAKALVLHYPLNQAERSANYVARGGLLNNSATSTTWSSDTQQYTIVSPVGTSTWGYGWKIPQNFTVPYGSSYRVSCEIFISTQHKFQVDVNNGVASGSVWSGNDNDNTSTRTATNFTVPANTWTKVVWGSTNSNASNTDKIGITPYDCIGCITSSDSASVTWYVKNVKVEINNVATPYCPSASDSSTWSDNIEYDTSGYGNNGTLNGTMTLSQLSPRNTLCYTMSNGTDHIKIPRPLSTSPEAITVACWIKPSSSNGGYSIYASNYNSPASGFWLATNTEGQGLWCYISGLYIRYSNSLSNDTWYHVAITYNGSAYQWYLNGSAVTTTLSTTIKPFTITDYIGIGNSYTGTSWNTKRYGAMSDFRIYATALSATDILELYNSPISITKNGSIMTQGEIIEE